MEFQQLVNRAMSIRQQYAKKEQALCGSPWNTEEIALGFVGDVGDLAKLVMAENGRRDIPRAREKLGHELADCMWSVIVLACLHGIDLESTFITAMDELEDRLAEIED